VTADEFSLTRDKGKDKDLRKTFEVEKLRARVNEILDVDICPKLTADNRATAATLLSEILLETGNYKGFGYTDGAQGAIDDSRRRYY
jgi:hypothetical protein